MVSTIARFWGLLTEGALGKIKLSFSKLFTFLDFFIFYEFRSYRNHIDFMNVNNAAGADSEAFHYPSDILCLTLATVLARLS